LFLLEEGREGGREGGRERGREGCHLRMHSKEGGREGGREEGREGGVAYLTAEGTFGPGVVLFPGAAVDEEIGGCG